MSSFVQNISIFLMVFAAICNASPARLDRLRSTKSRFLARQEVAEDLADTQTPYPPAGIQPEVKFALPTEEKLDEDPEKTYLPPSKTYGPPAKTYGPPESSVKDEVEQLADDALLTEETKSQEPKFEIPNETDSSEQPEESEEEDPEKQESPSEPAGIEADEIEAEAVKNENELKTNLPARLIQDTDRRQKSAKLQIASPQIVQPVYYFNYNGQLYRILN